MSDIRISQMTVANGTRAPIRASSYTEQTTNAQRSLSSTSANDTASSGSGVRTVKVVYYDQNMDGPFEEIVSLNGTTAVDTAASDICYVESMEAVESGAAGLAAGNIRLHAATGGAGGNVAQINALDVRTRYAHHHIPSGRRMNLKLMVASAAASGFLVDGMFRKYGQPVGSPYYAFQPTCASFHVENNAGPAKIDFEDPVVFTGPGKFELYGKSDNALTGGTVYADFSFYET